MPTIVANSIGSGKTYSTVALWEADGDIDLVTQDKVWKGELYTGELTTSAATTLSGATTDSTRYKWLTAASGESFADNANKLTNALYYNTANGAAFRQTSTYTNHLVVSENYAVVSRLQIKNGSTTSGYGVHANATNVTIRDCIIQTAGYGNAVHVNVSTAQIINCLVIAETGRGIQGDYGTFEAHNCTFIRAASASTTGMAAWSSSSKAINCAIFNFTSASSGTFASGSGNNATDLASAPGSSNQVSKTFANQFESSTNDFRAKGTGDLDLNGVADSTYTSDLDIVGQTRSASTPTIGCWEVVSGGAYTLTADAGSYALSGQDATLTRSKLLTADAGSYSLAGQDATLSWSSPGTYTLTAEAGSYAISGQAATLLKTSILSADAGAYSISGQAATLSWASAAAYTLTAEAGAYILQGQTAVLTNSGEVITTAAPAVPNSIDWGALVAKTWGKDYVKPEWDYEFSNGRRFLEKKNPYS